MTLGRRKKLLNWNIVLCGMKGKNPRSISLRANAADNRMKTTHRLSCGAHIWLTAVNCVFPRISSAGGQSQSTCTRERNHSNNSINLIRPLQCPAILARASHPEWRRHAGSASHPFAFYYSTKYAYFSFSSCAGFASPGRRRAALDVLALNRLIKRHGGATTEV